MLLLSLWLILPCVLYTQSCNDKDSRCRTWTRYCTSRGSYVYANCKRTCNLCSQAPSRNTNCIDESTSCPYWASRGECRRNPGYMNKSCKLSCRICAASGGNQPNRIQTTTSCVDKNKHCRAWAGRGECRRNARYMDSNCRKSCGRCTARVTPTRKHKPKTHKPHHKHDKHKPKTHKPKPPRRETTTTTTTTTPPPPIPPTTTTTRKPKIPRKPRCGVNKYNNPFIKFVVGGITSLREKWIWQAGISYYDQYSCGGTLIAPQYVLTAAHCLNNGDDLDTEGLEIILGDHNREKNEIVEQKFTVEKFWVHPNYGDPDNLAMNADIGLIKLARPAKLNRAVGIACLPNAYENVDVTSKCYISGWGKMSAEGDPANLLQEAKLPLLTNSKCGTRNKDPLGIPMINKNMLCAGKDTGITSGCQGDSGGPLVCKDKTNRWVVQGAVSWGSTKCENEVFYTVFARVSQYVDWIKARMN